MTVRLGTNWKILIGKILVIKLDFTLGSDFKVEKPVTYLELFLSWKYKMHQSSLEIISDNHFIMSKDPKKRIRTYYTQHDGVVTAEHLLFGVQKSKMPFQDHNESYY